MSLSLSLSFFLRLYSFIHITDQKRLFSFRREGLHFQHLGLRFFPCIGALRGFFRSVAARSAPLIKPSKESVAFQARTFQLNGRNYGVCVIKAAVSFPADRRIGLPNPAWNKPDTPWPSQLKEVCKVNAAVRVEFDCCSNSPFLERIRLHWTSD